MEDEKLFSNFLKLDSEKQQRIINAAIDEFSEKGYKNAMTDEIAKEANISKGSLFHYFRSKKDLFLFLYDHTMDLLLNEYFKKIDYDEKDVFIRLRQVILRKSKLVKQYPNLFEFIRKVNYEDNNEFKENLESKNQKIIASSYSKIFKDFDTSKFKEGFDINRAVSIIIWTMEGYANTQRENVRRQKIETLDYQKLMEEVDLYFDILKGCFYK